MSYEIFQCIDFVAPYKVCQAVVTSARRTGPGPTPPPPSDSPPHSRAINANQSVGCSRFYVIIEIPVILLLSPGSRPRCSLPALHRDHPRIDPHPVRFHRLPYPIIPMLRKWFLKSSVACVFFSSPILFSKEVASNGDVKRRLHISFVQYSVYYGLCFRRHWIQQRRWRSSPPPMNYAVKVARASLRLCSFSTSQLKVDAAAVHHHSCRAQHWLSSRPPLGRTGPWAQWSALLKD